MSALSHLRVLELCDSVSGEYCGKLLADFGAEIIKIESPEAGSATRHAGPFGDAGRDCERSGLFAYLNTNKRSVCLDLTNSEGRQALLNLVGTVDAVLDDHSKGHLESLGLDPIDTPDRFPGLILCSVTPFGYDTAPALRKAYGLNVLHSSWGYHSPSEADPAKPPLKGAGRFLVDYESGLSAALALSAALYWRHSTGRGQFIDVSQQESMASLVDYVLGQMVAGTMEASTRREAFDLRGPATFFACSDGYVYLWMSEPAHWNGMWTLMGEPQWMREYPERWLELHLTKERIDRCRLEIGRWMKSQSKTEVATRAQKLGVPLVPVNTVEDVFRSPQMEFRKFFAKIEHPTLGRLNYPTVPYRMSATPASIATSAPLLGEDTEQVLRDAALMRVRWVPSNTEVGATGTLRRYSAGPLQGVRVLEHTKIWAGPYVGKLLAFLGAEVIRVESHDSLDATRRFGTKDINDAPGFQAINPGKYSVQLSLKSEEGRQLIKKLVSVSDIFIENLRPGAAKRQGLGYEQLRAIKPDIIAVSMSMYGQEGPLSYQTGYAPCFSALAGICHLVGYQEGPPQLLNIRYGDSSYGTAAAFAAIVALCHKRNTGEGQFVDVSAVESLASVLGDSFMSYFMTGRVPSRDGNSHSDLAPHGCYPCLDAEWISIAVRTDEEWRALCHVMGQGQSAQDPRYVDRNLRRRHVQELDSTLSAWTCIRSARELEADLQRQGVAAFKSQNSIDLVSDEHLWQRQFYAHVTDDNQRSIPIVGAPWRMSVTPTCVERAAPRLGEHNDYVLGTLLGLSATEIERLIANRVVY